jgi:hypothetical protein
MTFNMVLDSEACLAGAEPDRQRSTGSAEGERCLTGKISGPLRKSRLIRIFDGVAAGCAIELQADRIEDRGWVVTEPGGGRFSSPLREALKLPDGFLGPP